MAQRPDGLDRVHNQVNERSAMTTAWKHFSFGSLQSLLEKEGFQNFVAENITENVAPLMWLFYLVAYIPFSFIRLLRLEAETCKH